MSHSVECPDRSKLHAYAADGLAQDAVPELEAHLADCPACMTRLKELGRGAIKPEIPDCQVVRELGRGRFGVVYKAWRLGHRPRIVALKVLTRPGDMEKSRFDREITVLKKLDSPGIVKCIDSGEADDEMYFVMDLVDGKHLDEYFVSTEHDLAHKLEVFERICVAVADAHDLGVTHRDLKPRNILVDADGQPHILDFGICSVNAIDWSSDVRGTITHPGDIIGTLRYMSPEQAWGGAVGRIDERSDIWALGIILHELVTDGGYPYSLKSTPDKPVHEAVLDRIRKELPQLPNLSSLPRGRDLDVLLQRCLTWETEDRLSSARTLANDIRRYLDGQPITTKSLWIPYQLKRLAVGAATRSRWPFAAVFVAMTTATLWLTTMMFSVGWRVDRVEHQPLAQLDAGHGHSTNPRDGIVIVGISDETVNVVRELAPTIGQSGVTSAMPTWRGVHAQLLRRLARVRPAGVAWDFYFRSEQPADAELADAIEHLERIGVPVILASDTYDHEARPELSRGLSDRLGFRLRHGAIVARNMVQRPGAFVLAYKPNDNLIIPALTLTTVAALRHPEGYLDIEWTGRNAHLDVLCEIRPGAYLRERDRIDLTKVVAQKRDDLSVRAGDMVALSTMRLESPTEWSRRTVAYERLLTAADEELETQIAGKLVIVGDLRTPRFGFQGDRHSVKYGATVEPSVPGCYLVGDAIAGLLNRSYVRLASPLGTPKYLLMVAMAVVGFLVPIRLATLSLWERRGMRRTLLVVVAVLSGICYATIVLADGFAAIHVGMAGFCLLTVMIGSLLVEFTRNRHRIAERKRQSMNGLTFATEGTVTLPLKRRKRLQAAR